MYYRFPVLLFFTAYFCCCFCQRNFEQICDRHEAKKYCTKHFKNSSLNETSAFKFNLKLQSPYGKLPLPYTGVFAPLYTTNRLDMQHRSIHTAILIQHGESANVKDYFCWTTNSIYNAINTGILVIAPFFDHSGLKGHHPISGAEWQSGGLDSDISIFFNNVDWIKGSTNINKPSKYISSYDVYDNIIKILLNKDLFPNMTRIVISGFSAGAQFINHYAWASSVGNKHSMIRFVISDPSSYLYLIPLRPAKNCRLLLDTGNLQSCNNFSITNACSGEWNNWKYGLNNLPTTYYFKKFNNSQRVIATATMEFLEKEFLLILGENDYCNCNQVGYVNAPDCFMKNHTCSPNPYYGSHCCDTFPGSLTSNVLDHSCAANMQGYNRKERGLLYLESLKHLLPEYQPKYNIVSGMSHDAQKFLKSDAFLNWILA